MKKEIFLTMVAFTIVCGEGLLSCDSETDQIYARTENSKLDDFIEAAEIHSMALEQYFQEEMIGKREEFTRSLDDGSVIKRLETSVARIVNDLTTTDQRLKKLVNKYGINDIVATRSSEYSVEHLVAFVESAFAEFEGIVDQDLLKVKISKQLEKEEYRQFSKEEQDLLLFVFAIYVDSIAYWNENAGEWCDVMAPKTRWPMSPWEREIWIEVARDPLGQNDAWGGLGGGLVGTVSIPVIGIAGGPGGVAFGWLCGAVWSSLQAAILAQYSDIEENDIQVEYYPGIPVVPVPKLVIPE